MAQLGQDLASWWGMLGPLGTFLLVGMIFLAGVAMFQVRDPRSEDWTPDDDGSGY